MPDQARPFRETPPSAPARLPRGVWALGLVSLTMDLSSEMIHALLPLFLVGGLGVSALSVGIIEGIAEATASIVKIFSGTLSDWLGRRKALALAGYGLAAVTKPLFPLADTVGMVLTARFIDRIGKGIRGAPRDALIADLTPPASRGAAYGLRQALDTVGAVIGPLAAVALMAATGDSFRTVFWIAVIPAFIAVAVLAVGVHDPVTVRAQRGNGFPLARQSLARMGRRFWALAAVAAVMTLARFSEAFLLLRAEGVGLTVTLVPLVLALMNVTYTATAYPIGRLSDRIGRTGLLAGGMAVLVLSDLVLALAGDALMVFVGTALWGLHMGMTQGLLAAMVADGAPTDRRGTAFGLFHLITGVALLLASVLAGTLWTTIGPAATFLAGALLTAAALIGLVATRRRGSGDEGLN